MLMMVGRKAAAVCRCAAHYGTACAYALPAFWLKCDMVCVYIVLSLLVQAFLPPFSDARNTFFGYTSILLSPKHVMFIACSIQGQRHRGGLGLAVSHPTQ
jgi:hypothetical protein